jgi:hypothetical protein
VSVFTSYDCIECFPVKYESLSPLMIECDCAVFVIWCCALVVLCLGDGFL